MPIHNFNVNNYWPIYMLSPFKKNRFCDICQQQCCGAGRSHTFWLKSKHVKIRWLHLHISYKLIFFANYLFSTSYENYYIFSKIQQFVHKLKEKTGKLFKKLNNFTLAFKTAFFSSNKNQLFGARAGQDQTGSTTLASRDCSNVYWCRNYKKGFIFTCTYLLVLVKIVRV